MKLGPLTFYRHDLGDYMRRWILVHPWGTIRVHHIMKPDGDPHMHSHPFDFVSFIFRGGYVEQLPEDRLSSREKMLRGYAVMADADAHCRYFFRTLRAPAVNRSKGDAPHRIQSVDEGGAWTLVFSGTRVREWGFFTRDGFVNGREYTSRGNKGDFEAYKKKIDEVYHS